MQVPVPEISYPEPEPYYEPYPSPAPYGHHPEPAYGHHLGKRDADPGKKRRRSGNAKNGGKQDKRDAHLYSDYGPPPPQPKITIKKYQQCKEVEQETCFNVPVIKNEEVEVKFAFPKANRYVTKAAL